ncbi:MAG: hypothetical protein HW375_871 [Anaerolineales bacterium]|nr:hypothetical protein [Anaerolineales bacterium]
MATTPASPPIDHPNLLLAVGRLRRMQWVWAVLFAGLGGLALASTGIGRPFLPMTWITIAAILVAGPQPIYLSLAAVAWGFSLIFLVPGIPETLGADPIALAVVRLVLLITAWNQFLLYRLLYGTQQAAGLDPALPPIPSVVANPSDRVAMWARWLGFLGLMAAVVAIPLPGAMVRANLLAAAYSGAVFAVGLGLGAAFVPTHRRSAALTGVALGCLSLLAALLVGRALGTA